MLSSFSPRRPPTANCFAQMRRKYFQVACSTGGIFRADTLHGGATTSTMLLHFAETRKSRKLIARFLYTAGCKNFSCVLARKSHEWHAALCLALKLAAYHRRSNARGGHLTARHSRRLWNFASEQRKEAVRTRHVRCSCYTLHSCRFFSSWERLVRRRQSFCVVGNLPVSVQWPFPTNRRLQPFRELNGQRQTLKEGYERMVSRTTTSDKK